MKRFIQELFVSTLGSAIGFWLIAEFHWIFLSNLGGSDMDSVFAGIWIGLPLGSILSLYILKKVFFKEKKVFTFFGLLGGIACSLFIGIFGVVILDVSKYLIFLLPIIISICFMMFLKRPKITE